MAIRSSSWPRGGAWVGPLGVVLAVLGLTVYALWPEQRVVVSVMEGGALVCFLFLFVVHLKEIRQVATGRAARWGVHSVLLTIVFVAIVGLVNVLAARHNVRWDLSGSGQFSLAPQTIALLQQLDRDVKVTLFVQDLGQIKEVLKGLVESYQYHTDRLEAEFVDPNKRPAVASQYGISQMGTVVFERGDQETRLRLTNQEELNNREQLFTNALIRVTRTEKKKIVFIEGHGEHRIDDAGEMGFTTVKQALEQGGYEVSGVSVAREGRIPPNTTLVVGGGATTMFAPLEVDTLREYLRGGGRLLLMTDPRANAGLDLLLTEWGVELDHDLIIEREVTLFGAGPDMVFVNSYSASHAITKEFSLSTVFPAARSLHQVGSAQQQFQFEALVTTSEKSWGETDLESRSVQLDRLQDLRGPLVLGASISPLPLPKAEQGTVAGHPDPAARFVIFGDSDFVTNKYFRLMGNGDLFLNTVNWLAEEDDTISIRPKVAGLSPLILSSVQENTLFLVSVVILPGVSLFIGLGAWQWRRRL